ncbi:MAG TPA: hypothetical protein VMP03_07160 [Methylomirabilota bacterium]|nr:hypothetical protein [Methylomirabilota bacterium]
MRALNRAATVALLGRGLFAFGCGDDGGGNGGGGDAGAGDAGAADARAADATPTCENPGTQACSGDGNALEVCSGTGELTVEQCEYGCQAGACNACTPSTIACQDDAVVTCTANGDIEQSVACALGCTADPDPRCLVLEPSNLPAATCDTAANLDLIYADSAEIDTDTACTSLVVQADAPDICVVRGRNVTIAAGVTIRVTGGRALAIVATGDLTLDGTLDSSAIATGAGPGAVGDGIGGAGGVDGDGGGGAGHHTSGGMGGTGPLAGASGGVAGTSFGLDTLVPLRGGSGGGQAGGASQTQGGGGGGAVQLVACGSLTIGGVIHVGGGGGEGGLGVLIDEPREAGGGGGSGGGVLLEAAVVNITGTLAANGGGGGGGGVFGSENTPGQSGGNGADATASATPALGGAGPFESGDGGDGAAGTTGPEMGETPALSTGSGGGGGGAAGRIRLNVRAGTTPTVSGTVTPAASNGEVATH